MITTSIRVKLTLLMLALTLPALIGITLYTHTEKTAAQREQLVDFLTSTAEFGSTEIEETLHQKQEFMQFLAAVPLFVEAIQSLLEPNATSLAPTAAQKQLSDRFTFWSEYYTEFVAFTFSDTNGRIIATSGPPDITFLNQEHFHMALDGKTTFSDLYPVPYERNTQLIFLSTPTIVDNQVIGVLTAHIDASALFPNLAHMLEKTKTGEAYVIDRDGYFLTSSRFAHLANRTPERYLRAIAPRTGKPTRILALNNEYTLSSYENYLGEKVVGIINTVPETPWRVIVEISVQEAYAPLIRLQVISMILLLLSGAVILTGAYSFGKKITTPLGSLMQQVQAIKDRQFKQRVNIETHDELEALGTSLNSAAEDLQRAQEASEELDRAKTRFLSITSHELRSPMTPLKAQLQMLAQEYFGKLNTKQKTSVATMVRNAERLDKLLVDFIEINRMESGRLVFEYKKTNVGKIIKDICSGMETVMPEKKISLVSHVQKMPIVETDPDRLSQILRNLLSNAIKFSPSEGQVEVTARLLPRHLFFSVKDKGIGIPAKHQANLFQPFFQVEQTLARTYQGTGLGLAICKGIIETMGGRIWVESQPGRGSTFNFTLPLVPKKTARSVKVVFTAAEDWETRLKNAFARALSENGLSEFERLKKEGLLIKEELLRYATQKTKDKTLTSPQAETFKKEIADAFK